MLYAISVHQPWASLLTVGAKSFETRSWAPSRGMIGRPIAIHASRTSLPRTLSTDVERAMEAALGLPAARWAEMPRGAVVAVARLTGAYRVASWTPGSSNIVIGASVPGSEPLASIELRGDEAHFGEFGPGRWLWWLTDVTPLDPPTPARGHQRLWYWRRPAGA